MPDQITVFNSQEFFIESGGGGSIYGLPIPLG
jgi:hypothetical protein